MTNVRDQIAFKNTYVVKCIAPDGTVRWREEVPNLVVNAGLNDVLSKYFLATSFTTHYIGLKGSSQTPASSETIAAKGWNESTAYSNGSRRVFTATAYTTSLLIDNSTAAASFTINQDSTQIWGAFVVTGTAATQINSTQGTLYGAANFASVRSVLSGDTLNVTATLTAAST